MNGNKKSAAWLRRVVLIVLLLTAAGLAFAQTVPRKAEQPVSAPVSTPEPDRRALREAAYEKDIAALQELMNHSSADEATRVQAGAMLERLIGDHQTELALEKALEAAGCTPKLVLMQNGALTIMLDGQASAEISALILELCAAHADVAAENVRIMGI